MRANSGSLSSRKSATVGRRNRSSCAEPAQLVDALEQERQLRGQREARHVVVEAREKRVVVGLLEQLVGMQPVRELAREARLAGADRTFDDDVAAGGEVHCVVG